MKTPYPQWISITDFVMQDRGKLTAFVKNKMYQQVGEFENGIELINEQGYVHEISGSCLKSFKPIKPETTEQ